MPMQISFYVLLVARLRLTLWMCWQPTFKPSFKSTQRSKGSELQTGCWHARELLGLAHPRDQLKTKPSLLDFTAWRTSAPPIQIQSRSLQKEQRKSFWMASSAFGLRHLDFHLAHLLVFDDFGLLLLSPVSGPPCVLHGKRLAA